MGQPQAKRWRRMAARVLGAIGVSVALSGCVVEPLWGPHYYRPYHYGYGYRGY